MRTIKRSSGLEQGRTEKLETYNPGNKYHTHLYDPVTKKFDLTEIEDLSTSDNEELVKSYYQMLAYNKMQSEEDLRISQLDLGDSAKCVQGNVNEFIYPGCIDIAIYSFIDIIGPIIGVKYCLNSCCTTVGFK